MNLLIPFWRNPFGGGLLLGVLLLAVTPMRAQFEADSTRQCPARLAAGTALYESGRIVAALDTLDGCDIFRDRGKQQAYYRLMCLCYLEIGQVAEAEAAMKLLLRYFPLYKPSDAVDPKRYIELHEKFRTAPQFIAQLEGGTNFTDTRVLANYSLVGLYDKQYIKSVIDAFNQMKVDSGNYYNGAKMDVKFSDYSGEKYDIFLVNNGLSFRASVGVGLSRGISLMLQNGLNLVTYGYKSAVMQPAVDNQQSLQGGQTITANNQIVDSAYYMNINPLYRYEFTQRLLYYQPALAVRGVWPGSTFARPYAEVSAGGLLRLSSSRVFETFITPGDEYPYLASPPEPYAILREPELIRSFQPFWGAGAGVYLGRGKVNATLGISATQWMGNILDSSVSRFEPKFVSQFFHVDDDLTLTSYSVMGGIIFNFAYQVKHIKHHEK